jgi:hypothetical protein
MLLGANDKHLRLIERFAGCSPIIVMPIWSNTPCRAWSGSGYSESRWVTRT